MPGELSSDLRKQIEAGVSILKKGGVIAFPTDTVYGLGACADNPRAVQRVYIVKQRPSNMALPLLLADREQITKLADPISPLAWCLIDNFLPGALTIVLPRSSSVPDHITAGGKTVAIRIPAHPVSIALIEGLGAPVIGTSANLSGQPSPLSAEEVRSQLGDRVDLIIDGGRCQGGKESTIVDASGEAPVILREGAISREEIERVCGSIPGKD